MIIIKIIIIRRRRIRIIVTIKDHWVWLDKSIYVSINILLSQLTHWKKSLIYYREPRATSSTGYAPSATRPSTVQRRWSSTGRPLSRAVSLTSTRLILVSVPRSKSRHRQKSGPRSPSPSCRQDRRGSHGGTPHNRPPQPSESREHRARGQPTPPEAPTKWA